MIFVRFVFCIFFFSCLFTIVKANNLDLIKDRGYLKCGVSEPRFGFANIDDESNWYGFDVDICRAVASAIFADSNKVEFILTTNKSRFPLLASGEIDMLSRITTWNFSRDVNLEFEFTGINFFDGQGFMVRSDLGVNSAKDLNGASICVIPETTLTYNLNVFFEKNNITYIPINIDYDDEAIESFLLDRCEVYTNFITELADKRITFSNPNQFLILPEIISKEPLSAVVRHGDDQWRDVVSWTLNVLIIAEEHNITSSNIDSFLDTDNNEILRLLGLIGSYGDMIELDEKWAYNIISLVGNYGEIFSRNLGPNTPINLNRGLNSLYSNGGLMYAPPFR